LTPAKCDDLAYIHFLIASVDVHACAKAARKAARYRISWFESERRIIRDAIREYIKYPSYSLSRALTA
jgi:hypothetical protein